MFSVAVNSDDYIPVRVYRDGRRLEDLSSVEDVRVIVAGQSARQSETPSVAWVAEDPEGKQYLKIRPNYIGTMRVGIWGVHVLVDLIGEDEAMVAFSLPVCFTESVGTMVSPPDPPEIPLGDPTETFFDTFTDDDKYVTDGHVSDSGHTWKDGYSVFTWDLYITSNQAGCHNWYATTDNMIVGFMPKGTLRFTADIKLIVGPQNANCQFLWNARWKDADNRAYVILNYLQGTPIGWTFSYIVDGVQGSSPAFTWNLELDTFYNVEILLRGNVFRFTVDDEVLYEWEDPMVSFLSEDPSIETGLFLRQNAPYVLDWVVDNLKIESWY